MGRVAALTCALVLAGVGVAVADSFGPMPVPDVSLCTTNFTLSAHTLTIGQTLLASAGEATANCAGPPTTVRWAWPSYTRDLTRTDTQGLIETRPCRPDAPVCEFKAVMFTQAGVWQGLGIAGSSLEGGWGSEGYYAILIQNYRELYGSISPSGTRKVTVSGRRSRKTVTSDNAGNWELAVPPGTYVVSVVVHHKTIKLRVKVAGKPGSEVAVFS